MTWLRESFKERKEYETWKRLTVGSDRSIERDFYGWTSMNCDPMRIVPVHEKSRRCISRSVKLPTWMWLFVDSLRTRCYSYERRAMLKGTEGDRGSVHGSMEKDRKKEHEREWVRERRERERERERERAQQEGWMEGGAFPHRISSRGKRCTRFASPPRPWRVDINVAARITNSINGWGKAAGAATIGLKLFSQREILLSPSKSNAGRQRIACRSNEMPSFFFIGISILVNDCQR